MIPLDVVEGIDWTQRQREHNPYNWALMVTELRSLGFVESASWIEANWAAYVQGVTQGFVVDLGADDDTTDAGRASRRGGTPE